MDNLSVNKHDLHIRRVDQECQFMAFFSSFIYTNLKRLEKRKHMFVILRIHTTFWKTLDNNDLNQIGHLMNFTQRIISVMERMRL